MPSPHTDSDDRGSGVPSSHASPPIPSLIIVPESREEEARRLLSEGVTPLLLDGTGVGANSSRRAVTALASLVALGAGVVGGPALAVADGTGVQSAPLTATDTSTTASSDAASGAATTTQTTVETTTTPSGTTTVPGATATTTTTTTATTTPPDPTATTTTTTPVTTTAAMPTPVVPTPTPGTVTTDTALTPTKVTGTKSVPAPKGRTHRQTPRNHGPRHSTGHGPGGGALIGRRVKARSLNRPKPKLDADHDADGETTSTDATSTITPVGGVVTNPWSTSAMGSPFSAAQLARYAALVGGMTQPPKYLVKIYKAAGRRYHLPWQVLAAINYVETGYGRDLSVSSAGAIGWMQFMPGTWAEYGVNVDARGRLVPGAADPWQPRDAIFSAARYLVANGATRNLPRAVFAYNHAGWYVQEVLQIAEQITTHGLHVNGKAKRKIRAMRTMARLLNGMPYVWGGGHSTWLVTTGYDCSGFVSAVLHAAGYLKVPADTQTLPDDPAIKPGPGRYVTIFDRTDGGGLADDHVIINIDGQFWEEGGGGISGADRVHRMRHVTGAYLQSFNLVLHPRGL